LFNDLDAVFVVTIKEFVGDLSGRILISQFKRFRTKPLDVYNGYQAVR
jgi:hypothetical protein